MRHGDTSDGDGQVGEWQSESSMESLNVHIALAAKSIIEHL